MNRDFNLLQPRGQGSGSPGKWDDFSAACREIEMFSFGPYEETDGTLPLDILSPETRATINALFSAIFSSRRLES
jgi:hypothetical protein